MYIEAEGNYLNIYMKDNVIRVRETMTNIENELSDKGFIRCHKGYLVNFLFVETIKNAQLDIKMNEKNICIPIGRSYEKLVKKRILELIRQ